MTRAARMFGLGVCACVAAANCGSPSNAGTQNFCHSTSQNMLTSCQQGARSDRSLASAICQNVADAAERKTCTQQASADLDDAIQGCKDQFDAREAACGRLGQGPYAPTIDPANFVAAIDNPFLPMTPGTTFIYEGQTAQGLEHNEVAVTHNTKVILGVTCVEVHDTVTLNGVLTEDTRDWFAQDTSGNVWYMGENSTDLSDGLVVSVEGSWTGGVDGGEPGIVMEAHPTVSDFYRQEFLPGTAEDLAEVKSLTEAVTVPYGSFTNCVKTEETSPLEPDALEHKFYAPQIGNIRTVDEVTGEILDLINIAH